VSVHALYRESATRAPSAFRDELAATVVRELALGARGPYRLPLDSPSESAWQLAAKLTHEAIAHLETHEWPTATAADVDEDLLWAALRVGLPLTSAFAPETFGGATRRFLRARTAETRAPAEQRRLEAELPEFISFENALWRLAGSEIAYAVRFALIEWFRPYTEGRPLPGICLRCGQVELRSMWSAGKREPRCDACRRRRRGDRDWPRHAIAYAARGAWWLRCQYESCTLAFEARGHAKYCPEHSTSRLTKSRRPRSIPLR
jgi:hypothetical protein